MSSYKGFTTVELKKPTRSVFDLSHEKRVSFKMGQLVPVFVSEVIPNDTIKLNTEIMLRLAPMLAPIMHRVNCFVHHFFVPNRLLWKDWEAFITNGRLGTETPPVPPNASIWDLTTAGQELLYTGSLYDYLGGNPVLDVNGATFTTTKVDLMPFAAYNKIWYDYYRDRNYVADNTFLPMASGSNGGMILGDVWSIITLRERDYQKDYFTSALPWTQRGNEVLMPLIGSGAVTLNTGNTNAMQVRNATTNALSGLNTLQSDATGNLEGITGAVNAVLDPNTRLTATVSSSGVSINDLRKSIRLQEWLERNALAGSRYNESILAHFARKTSDSRLQRAEYLGGGKVTVKISEIVTTAWSADGGGNNVPPANMAGHGLTFGDTNRITYNCEEHGFVISIMSVMPNTAYMQGSARMFFQRNTFLDYPWPSFAHLGEQPVYKYELYSDPTNLTPVRANAPVFGYQSRYADWKYIPSSSHGDFRTSLDFWHLTRKFSTSPVLGFQFCNFETDLPDRIFAVSGVETLWSYLYNNCTVKRSLPYYGTPQL